MRPERGAGRLAELEALRSLTGVTFGVPKEVIVAVVPSTFKFAGEFIAYELAHFGGAEGGAEGGELLLEAVCNVLT